MPSKKNTDRQQNKPSRVPVNRERWSESSQRTYALMEFYEDIIWSCRGCGQSSVFTAQEQKQAFEVEQVYIYWRPRLCDACAQKKKATVEAMRRYEARWKTSNQELQHDLAFLKQWVALLGTYTNLSGRRNDSLLQMLQQLIRSNQ